MSYLYRPTPVLNPGPQMANLSGAVSGGVMSGWDNSVNWKSFFEAKRAAAQGSPWLVKSGTMGSFLAGNALGDVSSDPYFTDTSALPLPVLDPAMSLDPLVSVLPPDFFNLSPPTAPAITPYNPGAPPSIVSAGGSILSPIAPFAPAPGAPLASVISQLASLGTNIAKAVTGQVNPLIPPAPPASVTPQQNNSVVAQAQANTLLAQAGSAGTSWLTQSTVISGFPNWGLLAAGAAVIAIAVTMKAQR